LRGNASLSYFQKTREGTSVYKTSLRISLFVIILMLPWAAIHAAGLGKLTLNSALGQPLNAEIDVVASNSDEVQSLKAGIASRETYTHVGVSYESILSSIKASVALRANGTPYIKLTSAQAINDPFLIVLMELSWTSGRVLREYTVLLDPIESSVQDIAAPNTVRSYDLEESPLKLEAASVSSVAEQKKNIAKSPSGSSKQTANTYGPVNRGDTLSTIARQVMPAGVNLNQMLVALHRANRDAFIAGNMNLLRTGVVLTIPEQSEIIAIDAVTANKEVNLQVDDWRNYQGKLSALSRETPASRSISQSDQGQITASIEKKSSAVAEAPKEVLKLSSGTQLTETGSESTDSGLVDRLRMMEEDATARNLALKEANERVAMLEKSVQNLKHLLELKDSVLAQAQMNAESQTKAHNELAAMPSMVIDPAIENELKAEIDSPQAPGLPEEISVISPVTEPGETVVATNPAGMPEGEDSSWSDLIFAYIEYIAAISILVLLLILLMIKRRRAKLQQSEDDEETGRKDFSSTLRSRAAAVTGAQAAVADGYAASEYHDQDFDKDSDYYDENARYDEEIESSAESEPARDDEETEQEVAHANDITGDDFSGAEPQGEFDLTDETDADANRNDPSLDQSQLKGGDFDIDTDIEQAGEDSRLQDTDESIDSALAIDFDETAIHHDDADTAIEEKHSSMDFDLSDSAINLTEDAEDDKKSPESKQRISLMDDSADDATENESLDFEIPEGNLSGEANDESAPKVPELGLADINLDLDDQPRSEGSGAGSEEAANSEQWQEVETKLDLAKAYLEMDDKEGAKEMLEEIMQDGDAKQKKVAKKMLKGL
jgi:pilus assembly protein FimV